jgi:hypothetical protein
MDARTNEALRNIEDRLKTLVTQGQEFSEDHGPIAAFIGELAGNIHLRTEASLEESLEFVLNQIDAVVLEGKLPETPDTSDSEGIQEWLTRAIQLNLAGLVVEALEN